MTEFKICYNLEFHNPKNLHTNDQRAKLKYYNISKEETQNCLGFDEKTDYWDEVLVRIE